jgi:hypothetical protein
MSESKTKSFILNDNSSTSRLESDQESISEEKKSSKELPKNDYSEENKNIFLSNKSCNISSKFLKKKIKKKIQRYRINWGYLDVNKNYINKRTGKKCIKSKLKFREKTKFNKIMENLEKKKSSIDFERLQKFLIKFLLKHEIKKEHMLQSELEKKIFLMFIQKKKYMVIWHGMEFIDDIQEINNMTCMTTEKRKEERLKKIFKLIVKYLRKDFIKQPALIENLQKEHPGLKFSPDDAFFYYYFYDHYEENKYDFKKIFGGKNKRINNKKSFVKSIQKRYSKASINELLLNKLKNCKKFFGKLEKYLIMPVEENELDHLNSIKTILYEAKKNIKKKMKNKINTWFRMYRDCKEDKQLFLKKLKESFNEPKYKLPWSIMDIAYSLNIFKTIISEK